MALPSLKSIRDAAIGRANAAASALQTSEPALVASGDTTAQIADDIAAARRLLAELVAALEAGEQFNAEFGAAASEYR